MKVSSGQFYFEAAIKKPDGHKWKRSRILGAWYLNVKSSVIVSLTFYMLRS